MAEFKTPTTKRIKSRITDNPDFQTPIKIPASPFLEKIGYGCGVSVFSLERSPKVGFIRSPWAIKKRNRGITEDPMYNIRIRFEADVLSKLQHPNIVGFRGLTEGPNGEPCLAMEKLDLSLGDVIENKLDQDGDPFAASDILKISYEIVKGLMYLHHTARILHGDVKSYNVLVSKNFNMVKLCDFGVSLPLTESLELDTSQGNFSYVGTDCWTAPEVLDDGLVTNKADVWAFGLVIWEMIALSPPHAERCEDSSMEYSFDDSRADIETEKKKNNHMHAENLDESVQILEEIINSKYGTRPPLPAIDSLSAKEYQIVLEIFFTCTTPDHKLRPSAKGIVNYFRTCVERKG